MRQKRAVIIEEIEEYISGIVKSIYQWKMGLYRDLTRENVLDYVLRIDTLLYSLVFCSLNNKRQERLDHESRTYIVPYSDNILEALEQFRNIFYNHYKEDLESYNKLLSMTKGLYDAIKILIGIAS